MLFLKIKKNFQNLFKTLAQKIFIMIYGKINIDDSSSMQNLKVYDIDDKNINTFFGDDYKIYSINFGRIYNDNVQNVAIINKNRIIEGPSYQQIEGNLKSSDHNICLKIGTPRIKKKFKGKLPKILYGGSVNPENIRNLKNITNLDGFLIGGASQNSKKFIDIVKKTYN